jgi:endo-1,4-beta-D-glucanase Y
MMIAVQLNKKTEFDRLWKFAKTYMRCPRITQCISGSGLDGYFSWQINKNSPYTALDPNPAPDGEEYYTTALIFASARWGNTGAFNYAQDAQAILDAMLNNNRAFGVTSMFNLTQKIVVFSPIGYSANYSDPSYHLPAFYELWARFDQNSTQRTFWQQAAAASRSYWHTASGSNSGRTNGLLPDCTDLNGTATYGCAGGAIYGYDAWRTISNIAVDYAWWAQDSWEKTEADRLQTFFGPKRPSYANQWNLDGTSAGGQQNSTGQIAMNAVAGLAGSTSYVWDFVSDVWNLPVPIGRYRYYDGTLYLLALLHTSGTFRIYLLSGASPAPSLVPSPSPVPLYDFNTDGKINSFDFARLLQLFPAYDTRADYNLDGQINALDVRLFLPHQFVL